MGNNIKQNKIKIRHTLCNRTLSCRLCNLEKIQIDKTDKTKSLTKKVKGKLYVYTTKSSFLTKLNLTKLNLK